MEFDKNFGLQIVKILKPFHDYVKEFEKRTGLSIKADEPLSSYGLNNLFGNNLLDLYNAYLELTFVRNVKDNTAFGEGIDGNESIKENPATGQSS